MQIGTVNAVLLQGNLVTEIHECQLLIPYVATDIAKDNCANSLSLRRWRIDCMVAGSVFALAQIVRGQTTTREDRSVAKKVKE